MMKIALSIVILSVISPAFCQSESASNDWKIGVDKLDPSSTRVHGHINIPSHNGVQGNIHGSQVFGGPQHGAQSIGVSLNYKHPSGLQGEVDATHNTSHRATVGNSTTVNGNISTASHNGLQGNMHGSHVFGGPQNGAQSIGVGLNYKHPSGLQGGVDATHNTSHRATVGDSITVNGHISTPSHNGLQGNIHGSHVFGFPQNGGQSIGVGLNYRHPSGLQGGVDATYNTFHRATIGDSMTVNGHISTPSHNGLQGKINGSHVFGGPQNGAQSIGGGINYKPPSGLQVGVDATHNTSHRATVGDSMTVNGHISTPSHNGLQGNIHGSHVFGGPKNGAQSIGWGINYKPPSGLQVGVDATHNTSHRATVGDSMTVNGHISTPSHNGLQGKIHGSHIFGGPYSGEQSFGGGLHYQHPSGLLAGLDATHHRGFGNYYSANVGGSAHLGHSDLYIGGGLDLSPGSSLGGQVFASYGF